MKFRPKILLAVIFLSQLGYGTIAQVNVDINLNMKHSVEGVSDFGRERHMTLHSSLTERDWNGHQDMMDYLINDLDVYFGRDNGSAGWKNSQVTEDPDRPNWPDINYLKSYGNFLKESYEADPFGNRRQYESKSKSMIMGISPHPNYPTLDWHTGGPGRVSANTDNEWQPLDVKASAYWMAHYLDNHFSKNGAGIGEPLPAYWECINEPDMEMFGWFEMFVTSPELLWEYHNETARIFKEVLGSHAPKVGGMTWGQHDLHGADFVLRQDPQFYIDNGNDIIKEAATSLTWDKRGQKWWQWDGMFQGFIDNCGENMDFYSVHIYDWPQIDESKSTIRAGGHTEAMLDLMEWYDMHKFGNKKEIVISEFGAVGPGTRQRPLKTRDWWNLMPFNQMQMQFLERPSHLTLTMPFAPVKAQWGDEFDESGNLSERYSVTMMDPVGEYTERPGKSRYDHENWEWSNIILFYELWKDVKGTRIDTKASDKDIQVDSYVDGKHVYLILNNLEVDPTTINLNYFDDYANPVTSVNVTHQHFDTSKNEPVNEKSAYATAPGSVLLDGNATMILDYEFANPVTIDQESKEIRFYGEPLTDETTFLGAQQCHVSVRGRSKFTAQINNVVVPSVGEATLRIGLNTFSSRNIEIVVNGHQLSAEGDDQDWRGKERVRSGVGWYGVLEQDVPIEYLQTNNVIEVTNHRHNSEYSTFILQTWDMTKAPGRAGSGNTALSSITIDGGNSVEQDQELPLSIDFVPANATDKRIEWSSSAPTVATVDRFGVVRGIASSGSTTITATSTDNGSIIATKTISAVPFTAISVTGISIEEGSNITIPRFTNTPLTATVSPADATEQSIEWSSSDTDIVEVTATGKLIGKTVNATATVTAKIIDTATGNTAYSASIEVFVTIEGEEFAKCSQLPPQVRPFETVEVEIPLRITGNRTVIVEFAQGNTVLATGSTEVDDFGDITANITYTLSDLPTVGTGYSYIVKLLDGTTEISRCTRDVEVIGHIRAESISITEGIRKVKIGDDIQLEAVILPENTFNKEVVWSSTNAAAVSVGADGLVTGISAGTASITATSVDGNLVASTTITSQVGDVVEAVTAIELPSSTLIFPGQSIQLSAGLVPAWTTQTGLVWSSSNDALATVDQNGVLTAGPNLGTVTIYATSSENNAIMGSTAVLISTTLIVEAEDFVDTGGDNGGFQTYEVNGVEAINYNQTGDWVDYEVNFPQSGEYTVTYYAGSPNDGAGITLFIDGIQVLITDVPNNGDYDLFQAIEASSSIDITAGIHTLRLESSGTADWQWNMDRFELKADGGHPSVPVTGISVVPTTLSLNITATGQLSSTIVPANASNKLVEWSSSDDAIATVDANGMVTAIAEGTATITALTNDGNFTATSVITVNPDNNPPVDVTGVSISPTSFDLSIGTARQLIGTVSPSNADNKSVSWTSSDAAIATVDGDGLVTAVSNGAATITITTDDGGFTASSTVSVADVVSASLEVDDRNTYLNTDYTVGGTLEVIANYHAGTGQTITNGQGGVKFWLRELTSAWVPVNDLIIEDGSAIGQESGTASATFSLAGLIPSADLPSGNFYFIYINAQTSSGEVLEVHGLAPINIVAQTTPPVAVTEVRVSPSTLALEIGQISNLSETVSPSNASNKNVSWSSSDNSIATVNSSGAVTALSAGSASITVTTDDGNYTAICNITVEGSAATIIVEGEDFITTDGTFDDSIWGGPGNGGSAGPGYLEWMNNGDWVEYTINVSIASTYSIEYIITSPNDGAQIQMSLDNTLASTTDVPNSGDWFTFETLSGGSVDLTAGTHVIRLEASSSTLWQWNLDKVILTLEASPTSRVLTSTSLYDSEYLISIYPTPTRDKIHISGLKVGTYLLTLIDPKGLELSKELLILNEEDIQFDMSGMNQGIYLLRISGNGVDFIERVSRK